MICDNDITDARKLLTAARQASDIPVFQTRSRSEFVLVSRVFHEQRLRQIAEFKENAGRVTSRALNQEFGFQATVFETDSDYKSTVTEQLTAFWRQYPDAPKMHLNSDTTRYWDGDFTFLSENINWDVARNLDAVLGNVARLHIDIAGDTKRENEILVSGLYTTECLENSTHPPLHPFAVTNQAWLQDGTIVKDHDLSPLFRPKAGDVLFMPTYTPHDPPELEKDADGTSKPRIMFTAEIRGLRNTMP